MSQVLAAESVLPDDEPRMPIEVGIWRIDAEVTRVSSKPLANEARLESILEQDITVLGLDVLLVIGRQVPTDFGKRIDLLAIDSQGSLYCIEIKRDRTPREVVAQTLDYGSWVSGLTREQVASIFEAHHAIGESFEEAFRSRFDLEVPDEVNESHQLIIVASELDPSTERIVSYLSDFGVPVNAVFFRYFQDGAAEYLARSWLLDPVEAEGRARRKRRSRPTWNGRDFYVSVGEGPERTWEDCVRYGFISGGQGRWYSQSLNALEPGHRIFACIPKKGFVGVGTVVETVKSVTEFSVRDGDGRTISILDANLKAPDIGRNKDNPDLAEYLVRVDWIKTVRAKEAIWETGMFANQNTACRLQGEKGEFTIRRLSEIFGVESDA